MLRTPRDQLSEPGNSGSLGRLMRARKARSSALAAVAKGRLPIVNNARSVVSRHHGLARSLRQQRSTENVSTHKHIMGGDYLSESRTLANAMRRSGSIVAAFRNDDKTFTARLTDGAEARSFLSNASALARDRFQASAGYLSRQADYTRVVAASRASSSKLSSRILLGARQFEDNTASRESGVAPERRLRSGNESRGRLRLHGTKAPGQDARISHRALQMGEPGKVRNSERALDQKGETLRSPAGLKFRTTASKPAMLTAELPRKKLHSESGQIDPISSEQMNPRRAMTNYSRLSRAARTSSPSSLTINFNPTVEFRGTTDQSRESILDALNKHSHELLLVIEQEIAKQQRAAFLG